MANKWIHPITRTPEQPEVSMTSAHQNRKATYAVTALVPLRAGVPAAGYAQATTIRGKALQAGKTMPVPLPLETRSGEMLAEAKMEVKSHESRRLSAKLPPTQTIKDARLVRSAREQGGLCLDTSGEVGVLRGLAVVQGERSHYYAGVRRETNGASRFLEHCRGRGGQAPELVKTVNLDDAKNVKLRITANDANCNFEFAADGGTWSPLAADQAATLLTTEVIGGFVGATVGPQARIEPPRTGN